MALSDPLVSIVLPVRNALAHLPATIDAIRRQSYPRYELVIQDGASTDGTLDYLSTIAGLPDVRVASAPDSGIGQAYNRGLQRATGDFICFAAADEVLEEGALARGVEWARRHPEAVAINGSVRLVNRGDRVTEVFRPPHFDLLRHLRCDVVLAFAGVLNRRRIGSDLYYDESLKTCPDYDFWIRLGSRFEPDAFVAIDEPFKAALADATSMSYRADAYDQFCVDKMFILNRYLATQPGGPLTEAVRRAAAAGIYAWAAQGVFNIEGGSPRFIHWCRESARLDPWSERLATLAEASRGFRLDPVTGELAEVAVPQADEPTGETSRTPLDLKSAGTDPSWALRGATVEPGPVVRVRTPASPWQYAAEIPLSGHVTLDPQRLHWVRLELTVVAGEVGVSLLVDGQVLHERAVTAAQGRTTVFIKVSRPHARGILLRNGQGQPASEVELLAASIESIRRPQ